MNNKKTTLLLRIGILALAFEAAVIGVQALFFPLFFYENFFLGRGWVAMLPPYNEHITRDLGALYLGFFVVLAFSAYKLTKDVVNGAVLGFMVATIPHMVFHGLHTDDAPLLLDKILQVGLLAVTVILSIAILVGGRRYFQSIAVVPSHGDWQKSPKERDEVR